MAIISTDQELFVFDNKAGYTGQNYVSADNANQLIGLTPDAVSAIESVSGIKTNVDYLVDCCSGVQSAINVLSADVSGKMDESLFSYNTQNLITAYNNSAFAGQGGGGGDMNSSLLQFNSENKITAYNNSAFANTEYSAGNNISIHNDVITVTGVALPSDIPSLDGYLQGSDLSTNQFGRVSAISGKTIIAYQAQSDWSGNVITTTYATKTELNNKQNALTNAQLSAISSVSGKQDKLTNAQLSAISSVSGKQNALTNAQLSAISSVSGMYNMITAMSAMLSAQWQLSAGNGIAITNNTSTKTSVISLA